ncbi:pyridoxal phosphate-dependent transferase [Kalaharituber pfeilii]|nr:pyridoxal phosphate-dependent transferase [Kalaharituber pfeilii]
MAYFHAPVSLDPEEEPTHHKVGAWFLGPRAENLDYLIERFTALQTDHARSRQKLYPNDEDFITEDIRNSKLFQEAVDTMEVEHKVIMNWLSKSSIPFWSPRYNGHMLMESTMPAILGYVTTMLYNPNNVAAEASPITTQIEKWVGEDLCKMLGYTVKESVDSAWGHITCDGSIANLESIWAARNLKFYPLSLKLATTEGKLKFLVDDDQPKIFDVEICEGQRKPFKDCSVWELLNLRPLTVLSIPNRLWDEYGISQTFLEQALNDYSPQTMGKDALEKKFEIQNSAKIMVPATKHYSWPKGAAITGIGRENVIDVAVDVDARMDMASLKKWLDKCFEEKTAVYAVVAVMGSTEQGAVDPLEDIVKLRDEYEKNGLSFVIHCDAAWGGYFSTMLTLPEKAVKRKWSSCVPIRSLNDHTRRHLSAFKHADSISIDPHKSGYCPYPAGSLCYRDGRLRYLITWKSPIVYHSSEEIGVYGVEGSKPGAAPVGAFLSHQVIGLNYDGYGTLLGEATYTCARLYCHWATMSRPNDFVQIVPLNMLPSERGENPDPKKIEEEKDFIRNRIIKRSNAQLANDPDAMQKLAEIGSDLMINAFAVNFKYQVDGKLETNEDVAEANYLNHRIFTRCSALLPGDKIEKRQLFLTSSTWEQEAYGKCADNFKRRLGLKGCQDLYVLVNVTMSPWPTANGFLGQIANNFKQIAEEECEYARARNVVNPTYHCFVMQGNTADVHLVYLPMFHLGARRYQVILKGTLPEDVFKQYKKYRDDHPNVPLVLRNLQSMLLPNLVSQDSFMATITAGTSEPCAELPYGPFEISNVSEVYCASLQTSALDSEYPNEMPFYLYGSLSSPNIEHLLRASPNVQLSSENVQLIVQPPLTVERLSKGVVALFTDVRERVIQPMVCTNEDATDQSQFKSRGFNFVPEAQFRVRIYEDWNFAEQSPNTPIATGTIKLVDRIFANWKVINADPCEPVPRKETKPDYYYQVPHHLDAAASYPPAPIPATSTRASECKEAHARLIAQKWKDWMIDLQKIVLEPKRTTPRTART